MYPRFDDDEANTFYTNIDSCVATGKPAFAITLESAETVTNAVVNKCVDSVDLPDELEFTFDYGVDCNKFHNSIVSSSTKN
jgi:hypothetical protein